MSVPEFSVISGEVVRRVVSQHRPEIVREVRRTYLVHERGGTVNPDSYFLRFPAKPDSRIIALPAYLGGEHDVAGIKWIASFPANIEHGIPRASAVLLLNDYATGYPFALLEAAQISAARTAASAVLAARVLTGGRSARRLAVVGAGIIARNILEFFAAEDWEFREVAVYDQVPDYAAALAQHVTTRLGYPAHPAADLATALTGTPLTVLATTAASPYLTDPALVTPGDVVLNISLRDISPQLVVTAHNVLDDVEHCLKAGTSPHLAEQEYGHRDFVSGTLAQVITGAVTVSPDKPIIFSPFGLGVLDLAVGALVYREARDNAELIGIPGFFGETTRW